MQATLPLSGSVPVPMPTGSLEAYVQTVNRIPMLTAPQERELALRFRDHNDLEAARGLVLSHLRLVVAVARGYLGYGLPHADLIQEGSIGLMKAVKRFDPERNVRLVSFAILDQGRDPRIHPAQLAAGQARPTKAQRKLFFQPAPMKTGLAPMTTRTSNASRRARVKPEKCSRWKRGCGPGDRLRSRQDDEDAYAPANYLSADRDAEPLSQSSRESEEMRAAGLEEA